MTQPLRVFQSPEHRPFFWRGGNPRLAVLVHGFPGTPAEMRPLAEALYAGGWDAAGILLPGFGPQIAGLGSYRYQDWVTAVTDELAPLGTGSQPVLLVGYSLGAAVAIHAAVVHPPAGLVLIAPFLKLEAGIRGVLLPVLKRLFPRFRPFEKVDFSDHQVRQTVRSFAPDANLDDPDVQAAVRELYISSETIDELRKAGRAAFRMAGRLRCPTFVVQGRDDELARASHTQRLVQSLPHGCRYHEVSGGHNLIKTDSPAWPDVRRYVMDFAQSV